MIEIRIEKLEELPIKNTALPVKLTEMGNIIEIQYMSNRNTKQTIQMLPGGKKFVILATGEVKNVEEKNTRNLQKKNLYKTFANLRGIINTNVVDVSCVRWCTLTYAENMTDTKQLYNDFRKFNSRFQYYCKKNGFGTAEYIVMMEPQGRGAWHAHLLYIWQKKAPYIPNSEFAELWGHGFVKVKKLDDVDNVGAYLTAYLGDMEIENYNGSNPDVKTVVVEDEGIKVEKKFLKGARLHLYPSNFNMYRTSKGIKRPISCLVCQKEAEKKVMAGTKTFESAIRLVDDNINLDSIIIKQYYNLKNKNSQV